MTTTTMSEKCWYPFRPTTPLCLGAGYGYGNDGYANGVNDLVLSNRLSDGVEKITSDICNSTGSLSNQLCGIGNSMGQQTLTLADRIATSGERTASDICHGVHELSNQHILLSNRMSDIGEKNVVATLNTGREVVKDNADGTRFLHKETADVTRALSKEICDTQMDVLKSRMRNFKCCNELCR